MTHYQHNDWRGLSLFYVHFTMYTISYIGVQFLNSVYAFTKKLAPLHVQNPKHRVQKPRIHVQFHKFMYSIFPHVHILLRIVQKNLSRVAPGVLLRETELQRYQLL